MLAPRLGGKRKKSEHVDALLRDCQGGYDSRWYYAASCTEMDFHYLNGRVVTERRPPQPTVRLLNAWETEVWRVLRVEGRYPTLAEQQAFLEPGTPSIPPSPPGSPTTSRAASPPPGAPPDLTCDETELDGEATGSWSASGIVRLETGGGPLFGCEAAFKRLTGYFGPPRRARRCKREPLRQGPCPMSMCRAIAPCGAPPQSLINITEPTRRRP